jgi:hypothetical protein
MKLLITLLFPLVLAGCSVLGESGVEDAPYTLLKSDQGQ